MSPHDGEESEEEGLRISITYHPYKGTNGLWFLGGRVASEEET